MRLPDSTRSRVILIGTSTHTTDSELTNLPAVANNLTDLASALSDDSCGWLTAQAQNIILDPHSSHDLGVRITQIAKEAEDLLLIYYAGHGLVDQRGNLHLALSGTQRDYLRYTALPFEGLREAVSDSPAKNRVVVLDCCYSGRAIDTMSDPEAAVYEQLDIAGTYTLTSTTATAMALAPLGERYTTFTGELIKLLQNGSLDAPDPLTLDHIYRLLHRAMIRSGQPRPQQRGTDTTPHLALARNRAVYLPSPAAGGLGGRHGYSGALAGINLVDLLTRDQLLLVFEARRRFGGSLDLEGAARELVELTVPELAGVATVELLTSVLQGAEPSPLFTGVSARSKLVASADAAVPGLAPTPNSVREVSEAVSTSSYAQGLRSGRSILISHLSEGDVSSIFTSSDRVQRALEAGVHSYLMVPLVSRGKVFGGVEFFRSGSDKPFGQPDVILAEEIAALAAGCMESVHHSYLMRAVSLELQQRLLPSWVRVPSGLNIAHRYVPASESNGGVGGDWFDVVALAEERAALIVGDVTGRGMAASAMMGQIRAVARALLDLGLEPQQVLTQLDRAVADIDGGRGDMFVTCVCAIYDPVDSRCIASSAGHPFPVLATADGTVGVVQLPIGLPLGVGGHEFVSETFDVPENGILLLYTDGLVETYGRSFDEGVDLLIRSLSRRGEQLEDTCDLVMHALITDGRPDDAVILMAQSLATATEAGKTHM
ncbi:PP2C family protein-serine/threonine phosphatase [Catenulispora rubra]|uniref:PP2C family protein-serine/threonine phosphatase n=1 Tax=Catenulispora rubra TaxID=280293 RepID=UPI0018928667|nr:PP2C family protein-serine/threonine phosphatase [Catenulispora rubra]